MVESAAQLLVLRQFTHTGRPLGSAAFVAELEPSTNAPACPAQARSPPKARRR
jgi:hypothetical protein